MKPVEACQGRALKCDGKGSASHEVLVSVQLYLILIGVKVAYGIFRSIESFDLRHSELGLEREVQNLGREQGFRLLYQSVH